MRLESERQKLTNALAIDDTRRKDRVLSLNERKAEVDFAQSAQTNANNRQKTQVDVSLKEIQARKILQEIEMYPEKMRREAAKIKTAIATAENNRSRQGVESQLKFEIDLLRLDESALKDLRKEREKGRLLRTWTGDDDANVSALAKARARRRENIEDLKRNLRNAGMVAPAGIGGLQGAIGGAKKSVPKLPAVSGLKFLGVE